MGQNPYYNQKVLRFINCPKDKQHPYTMFNKDALKEAMLNLSVNAFKLYIYLSSFKEMPESFNMSRKNASQAMNVSESSYLKAVKELQTKGYIIPDPTKPNKDFYIFIEHPQILPTNSTGV